MSTKRQDAVMRTHVPGSEDRSLCACDDETEWSPEHVRNELDKAGYRLVYKTHFAAYVDAGGKYVSVLRSAYSLLREWRTAEMASSPPEVDILFLCSEQVEEMVGLKLEADDPAYSPEYKSWKANRDE